MTPQAEPEKLNKGYDEWYVVSIGTTPARICLGRDVAVREATRGLRLTETEARILNAFLRAEKEKITPIYLAGFFMDTADDGIKKFHKDRSIHMVPDPDWT